MLFNLFNQIYSLVYSYITIFVKFKQNSIIVENKIENLLLIV